MALSCSTRKGDLLFHVQHDYYFRYKESTDNLSTTAQEGVNNMMSVVCGEAQR